MTLEQPPEVGPVQVLVVGFPGDAPFDGSILAELRRLREQQLIRLLDLLVVAKDAGGDVVSVELSDLTPEQRGELGAVAGALIGLGAAGEEGAEVGAIAGAEAFAEGGALSEQEVWYLADAIPIGTTAAVALIEHRWAIPLRDAIRAAGGVALVDTWIHPADLVALGVAAGES